MIATLHANTAEPWPLRDGTVHVWSFACAQDPGALAGVLSDDETRAARRFDRREHRERYVVQHAMLRALLARYVDVEPRAIAFTRGAHGKPMVNGVEFNLSHADDVALVAVSRGIRLGVDIERYDAELDLAALAAIVLAPDEAAARTDRHAFFRIWCRKEACLKATGIGLVDDLTSVSAIADHTEVRGVAVHVRDLVIARSGFAGPRSAPEGERGVSIDPRHAAALATTQPCAAVTATAIETFTTS